MAFKLIPAKTFPGTGSASALSLAEAWLTEICDGYDVVSMAVTGGAARAVVSGLDGGCVILRSVPSPKGKAK